MKGFGETNMNDQFDDTHQALEAVRNWVNDVVIRHHLCPFAREAAKRTGFRVTSMTNLETSIGTILTELTQTNPGLDNVLLIIADGADHFDDFWDICETLEENLETVGLLEHVQLAHFHPDYCFDGIKPTDRSNWTNRAPMPVLHFLSSDAVERAVEMYPDASNIPQRNINHLKGLSPQDFAAIVGKSSV